MRIPIYQVDAFTDRLFGGNPAAVCPLDAWLPDPLLQSIAAENNLAETAFFVSVKDGYQLRWFTPEEEMDLCGHATLASAFVLFNCLGEAESRIRFSTTSGHLTVRRDGDLLKMDFPSRPPVATPANAQLNRALGVAPVEVWKSRDLLIVLEDEESVTNMQPDFLELATIPDRVAVIVTAIGNQVDFVSRFFTPGAGIPEDPVTGSAHCTLIPFWSKRLDKKFMRARQLSARGGELTCEDLDERVAIGGSAVLYLEGTIII
ncbi:MAG TPA: PhzF family phenazine biosynthesis protein [Geopsychrobacteraceae bacterium]|nr:PhzF family phenazine biosynthesis protein [Geopsychrobacteraceae bacterium]